MQCTIIAVCANGAQVILGTDVQEHRAQVIIDGAVEASRQFERLEARYRSFYVVGTTDVNTSVIRLDARGSVLSRQVGLL